MGKAVLVMDMPSSCDKCPCFCGHYSDMCCMALNNRTINYPYPKDFRQSWCPLKELPAGEWCYKNQLDMIGAKKIDNYIYVRGYDGGFPHAAATAKFDIDTGKFVETWDFTDAL